jgi:membrane associated rhomboid family serine protease
MPIGAVIEEMFDTNKGYMLSLVMAFIGLSKHLLRLDWVDSFLSAGESLVVFAAYAALCLLMLSRRVRAYEVVS